MGTMVSIYDIMNGEPNWMELKFNKYKESFLVDEYYCINASCECQQVCLTFLKITEDGAANNKVFSFYLNLNTFKITDIDVLDPSYDFSYMISSFKESMGDFIGNYARNYKKAKEYGMKHNNLHTSKENIQESLKNGLTISYSDIFENSTPKTKGKNYSRDMNKPIISSKVGRNESCPCNSGKKFKHCCGRV